MATITQDILNIPDYYDSIPASVAGRYPPMSPIRFFPTQEAPVSKELSQERLSVSLDESTKLLIQVTGIWVALREGWSHYFNYNDSAAVSPAPNTRVASGSRVKSLSMSPDGVGQSSIVANTPESTLSTLGNVGDKLRRTCTKGSPAASVTSQKSLTPKRAVSTGSAFMQRATARRNPPSTVVSVSDGEAVFGPPKRATTENSTIPGHTGPPAPLTLNSSSSTTIDTPTRQQRRVQPAYVPPSTLHGRTRGILVGHSMDAGDPTQSSEEADRQKISRWKQFTNHFRRFAQQ